ncbi:deoxyribose-phosphate aldolase [Panacibacter ginsenosidivorans]|uniref:Deoxyribose-phosphate aldolase n=1 Tax=Panacibacter ginsenosidivorans TaxID=1813871 RepID=A0A5B8VBF9_9BACT|nr:deoxyribose-phosphate aldolase [Panacibacter ginsenosidivorans]QEC68682.1 deoxyribose-phosphate aldolase [Panacibacter ginsenosidivorans]
MQLNRYIDHTILKPTTLVTDIEQLCSEAKQYDFAAVCVPPPFVQKAKQLLEGSDTKTATVIGFPFGYSAIEAKIAEILLAMVDGADELDMVINLIALKNNDWQYLANEINHIMPVVKQKNKIIKIIIESGVLTNDEIIKCCDLYGAAGIDYLKTSTGYAEKGASADAVQLMRKHLPDHVKIKASGGIRTYDFARQLVDAGAERLGCSAGVAIMQQTVNTDAVY